MRYLRDKINALAVRLYNATRDEGMDTIQQLEHKAVEYVFYKREYRDTNDNLLVALETLQRLEDEAAAKTAAAKKPRARKPKA